jgi:hypothetical protein
MTQAELEQAYQQVAWGSCTPSLVMIRCDKCNRSFILSQRYVEIMCEHLRELFEVGDSLDSALL